MRKIIFLFITLFIPITLFSAFEFISDNNMELNGNSMSLLSNPAMLGMCYSKDIFLLFKTPLNFTEFDTSINSLYISTAIPLYRNVGTIAIGGYNLTVNEYTERFVRLGYGFDININKFYIDKFYLGIKSCYYYVDSSLNKDKFFSMSPGIMIQLNNFFLDSYCDFLMRKADNYLYNTIFLNFTYKTEFLVLKTGIKYICESSSPVQYLVNFKFNVIPEVFSVKAGYNYNGVIEVGFNYNNEYTFSEIPLLFLYEYSQEMQNIILSIGYKF